MTTQERFYEDAWRSGEDAKRRALEEAKSTTHEQLRAMYADMVEIAEFHTRLQAYTDAVPNYSFDQIEEYLTQLGAARILKEAEAAEEQGITIAGTCTVRSQPLVGLLRLLSRITRSRQ